MVDQSLVTKGLEARITVALPTTKEMPRFITYLGVRRLPEDLRR